MQLILPNLHTIRLFKTRMHLFVLHADQPVHCQIIRLIDLTLLMQKPKTRTAAAAAAAMLNSRGQYEGLF